MSAVSPLGRWRLLPVAIAAAIALLELSCMGSLWLTDTNKYLVHTFAARHPFQYQVVSPAYPLLLDLLCVALPLSMRMATLMVLQQAAVAAIPWLVLRSGEHLGRSVAGFVAALATALYLPLSLAAQVALTDALFAFLFAATVWASCRAISMGRAHAWLLAGALAAAAIALHSSGAALLAAPVVALLTTHPRTHLRGLVAYLAGFAAVLALACAKNEIQFGSSRLVQGGGIHLFSRVTSQEFELPDTGEMRRLAEVARARGKPSLRFGQSGWFLHRVLVQEEGLSPRGADGLLFKAATQALAADPPRTALLTWESMAIACEAADPIDYALAGVLRPSAAAAFDASGRPAGVQSEERFDRVRSLLSPYPPRADDDDWRFDWIERWARCSRAWCGQWILFALLALGGLGLLRRDPALVLLAGAPFAQLAACAFGDRPWAGHLDPTVPVILLAIALGIAALLRAPFRRSAAPRGSA